jgi:hypothetical protein
MVKILTENGGLSGPSITGAIGNDDPHAGQGSLGFREGIHLISPASMEKDERPAFAKLAIVDLRRTAGERGMLEFDRRQTTTYHPDPISLLGTQEEF